MDAPVIIRSAHPSAFERRYVCACCWGDLGVAWRHEDDGQYYCLRGENCTGKGFVTRNYADRRRSESAGELLEVKRNYPDLEGKTIKHSSAQLLKDLGF